MTPRTTIGGPCRRLSPRVIGPPTKGEQAANDGEVPSQYESAKGGVYAAHRATGVILAWIDFLLIASELEWVTAFTAAASTK